MYSAVKKHDAINIKICTVHLQCMFQSHNNFLFQKPLFKYKNKIIVPINEA